MQHNQEAGLKNENRRTLLEGEPLDICVTELQPDFLKLMTQMYRDEKKKLVADTFSFKKHSKDSLISMRDGKLQDIATTTEEKLRALTARETELGALQSSRDGLDVFQEQELNNISRRRATLLRIKRTEETKINDLYDEMLHKKREHSRKRKMQQRTGRQTEHQPSEHHEEKQAQARQLAGKPFPPSGTIFNVTEHMSVLGLSLLFFLFCVTYL